ncbi:MAG: hypothetical protein JW818_02940 [Pirellulales bacterium]|nr:hypothetical protein [Pirellulales bacterium]
MVKNRIWVERELLLVWGHPGAPYEHELELHVGRIPPGAYDDRSIVPVIEQSKTRWGSLQQLFSRLFAGKRGLWFYGGWIDQAALHVGKVISGDERLLQTMLNQIDKDQVDQCGDMLVGFAPNEEDWLFVVEVSAERQQFVVRLKANSPEQLQVAENMLDL